MNNLLSQSFHLSSESKVAPGPAPAESVAIGVVAPSSPGTDLTAFNTAVAEVERGLELLAHLTQDIQSMREESKISVRAAVVKDLARRIQRSVAEASRMAAGIKERLVQMKQSNEDNRSHPSCGKGTAIDRHRSAVTLALTRRLKGSVDRLMQLRNDIDREQREIITRRLQVVSGQELSRADLESILRNGLGDEVLKAAVERQGTHATDAVRDVLQEVEERSAAVKEIGKDLEELNQAVVDMAALVESQGEVLDQVEVHVGKAEDLTKAGVGKLGKARESQKNTRKWVLIGIILTIILLLILTGIIIGILKGLGVKIL